MFHSFDLTYNAKIHLLKTYTTQARDSRHRFQADRAWSVYERCVISRGYAIRDLITPWLRDLRMPWPPYKIDESLDNTIISLIIHINSC